MSDYREFFDRLSKCNLPAGFEIIAHPNDTYGYAAVFSADRTVKAYPGYEDAPACRAALMLIVDAMRAEGYSFEFADPFKTDYDFKVKACHYHYGPTHEHEDHDEVTALAECLIAALGVAE